MRLVSFIAALSIATAGTTSVALAQPNANGSADVEKISLEYFEKGQKLVAQKKYLDALAAFSAGYELSRRPLFLFNMAESARFAGNDVRARELYAKYIAEDPNGKMAAIADQRLVALGGAPAREPVRSGPPGAVTPVQPATTVIPTPSVAAASYEEQHATSSTHTIDLQTSPPIYKRPVFWVGVGVGAAVLTVATIAVLSSGDSKTQCVAPMCSAFDVRD